MYNLRIYIKLPIRRVTSEPKLPKSLYTIILFNTYCFVQNFNLSIQASDPRIILFRNNIYLWQTSVKTLTPVKSDRIVCYFYHGNGGVIQDGKSLFRIYKISGKANSFSYNCILKFFYFSPLHQTYALETFQLNYHQDYYLFFGRPSVLTLVLPLEFSMGKGRTNSKAENKMGKEGTPLPHPQKFKSRFKHFFNVSDNFQFFPKIKGPTIAFHS